jgi:hypothetical protein
VFLSLGWNNFKLIIIIEFIFVWTLADWLIQATQVLMLLTNLLLETLDLLNDFERFVDHHDVINVDDLIRARWCVLGRGNFIIIIKVDNCLSLLLL